MKNEDLPLLLSFGVWSLIVLVYVRLYCVTTVTSSYEGSYKYYCVTTVALSSEGSYCGTRGGGTQQSFVRGGSAPRSNPLPFCIPFWTEKVSFSYTIY